MEIEQISQMPIFTNEQVINLVDFLVDDGIGLNSKVGILENIIPDDLIEMLKMDGMETIGKLVQAYENCKIRNTFGFNYTSVYSNVEMVLRQLGFLTGEC